MTEPMNERTARLLLEHKAVLLQPSDPFTWASGIEAPIYTDNRQLLSYPDARCEIIDGLVALIETHYPEATVIGGTATAGIPHAAWISEKMNLPMVYIRGKAKDHGRKTQIEGHLNPDDKLVMIDDLISTGGSVLEAAKVAAEHVEVLGVASIFTYDFQSADDNFKNAGLTYHSLSDYPTLVHVAEADHLFSAEEIEKLNQWHHKYGRPGSDD